jgi:hypothetical protein
MTWKGVVLIVAALFLGLAAWLGRYEISGPGVHGTAYRLDRWTGGVIYMSGEHAGIVGAKEPSGKRR